MSGKDTYLKCSKSHIVLLIQLSGLFWKCCTMFNPVHGQFKIACKKAFPFLKRLMCTFPFITKDSTAHQRLADQTIKCHLATFCHGPQLKNLYKNAPFGASSCGEWTSMAGKSMRWMTFFFPDGDVALRGTAVSGGDLLRSTAHND